MTPRYKTLTAELFDGARIRRQLWDEPLWDITGEHVASDANLSTLDGFFRSTAKGMANSFTLTDTKSRAVTDMFCGTGDGVTTAFDIPAKTISAYTIYANAVEKDEGASLDYTIDATGGTDGRAECNWVAAPTDTHRLSIDFTGLQSFNVVFASDSLSYIYLPGRNIIRVSFVGVA